MFTTLLGSVGQLNHMLTLGIFLGLSGKFPFLLLGQPYVICDFCELGRNVVVESGLVLDEVVEHILQAPPMGRLVVGRIWWCLLGRSLGRWIGSVVLGARSLPMALVLVVVLPLLGRCGRCVRV